MHDFWPCEPDPKYLYYIGQSKNIEAWCKSGRGYQGAIYKDFEKKFTFTKHAFKESNLQFENLKIKMREKK